MQTERYYICPATKRIDEELYQIETEINWLEMLSPVGNDERWNLFLGSNFKEVMPLEYPQIKKDYRSICKRLDALPFDKIENSLLHALLHEKKEELDLQIDLIKERDREGFIATSISLFGGTSPSLIEVAQNILKEVPDAISENEEATVEDFLEEAEKVRAYYKEIEPDFDFKINVVEDLNSSMMVDHGELCLARSLHVPKSRIKALIAHEVEVHIITHYNGRQQPLKQLETGLAYYDTLQEGLASLSEYLAGNLPAERLRILAARVIAANLATKEKSVKEIFDTLYENYRLGAEDAFDTAVRAKRGGGLTKDACYLDGLRELLSYLRTGENLEIFFLGKFALPQRDLISKLVKEKVLIPPKLLPRFVASDEGKTQFIQAQETPLIKLYH